MMRKSGVKYLLWICLLCLFFTGCNNVHSGEDTSNPSYCVRFTLNGQTPLDQTVEAGGLPQQPVLPNGLQVTAWTDQAGNSTDPFSTPVYGDVVYIGQAYPALTSHLPYLFLDADGYLWPENPLTANTLAVALNTLAAPGAESFFPALPTGDTGLTESQVSAVLKSFFPEDMVFAQFPAGGEETVSRSDFAVGMQTLLGRTSGELMLLAKDVNIPKDIILGHENALCLLEASVPHTPDKSGSTWLQVELPSVYTPGLVNIHGYLYYVQEDGYFLRNGDVGQLHFGNDGRYSSTDADLDIMVADILADITEANPEGQRLDWLRSAFEYVRDNFTYRRREAYAFRQTGWELSDAKTMFETTKGNCYNFAAAFWALARGLGYEARVVSGTALSDQQPHGWVFIDFDGQPFIFDPEWEYVYRYERNDFTKDMFMLTLQKGAWWTYRW